MSCILKLKSFYDIDHPKHANNYEIFLEITRIMFKVTLEAIHNAFCILSLYQLCF